MKTFKKEELRELLHELERIGDELSDIESYQKDTNIAYYLSECGSSLVDARALLRKVLN